MQNKILLHVVGLPHTGLTDNFSWCAYTGKVRRFATMMTKDPDIDVVVYHAGESDPKGTGNLNNYFQIFTEEERLAKFSAFENKSPPFNHETFFEFNTRTILAIRSKLSKSAQNIICLIGGLSQAPIAAAFPALPCAEFGIGYAGVMQNSFRCFESYSWMHMVYGSTMGAYQADGRNYDTVIPNYYDPDDFSLQYPESPKDGYLLYLARTDARKGIYTALEVAKAAGAKLVIAGGGPRDFDTSGIDIEDRGFVEPEERRILLQGARALIQPTNFIEPFGGCVIESLLSGTPVMTSDWGAFTETVVEGRDGWRCRTLKEYLDAWEWSKEGALNFREDRRIAAITRFSTDSVRPKYSKWFKKIAELYQPDSAGWYKI